MKKTTFGLQTNKLISLLKIGKETHAGRPEEDVRASQIKEWLARPMGEDQTPPTEPRLLSDLLFTRQNDSTALAAAKDQLKESVVCALTPEQRDVATALYYATIASALVHHQQQISRTAPAELQEAFAQFQARSWLTEDLSDLFMRAQNQNELPIQSSE